MERRPGLVLLSLLSLAAACGEGSSSGGGGVADPTAPTAPTGLTATPFSSTRIDLSWSAATDDVGVTGYRVYEGATQVGATVATSFSHASLVANSTHCYTVKARDAAGNLSAASAQACATASDAPPPPPAPPLVVTTGALSPATTGSPFSQTITASGTGPFTWDGATIAPGMGGATVNGLTIGTSTGLLSGTPSYSGAQPVLVTVAGAGGSVAIQYELAVGGAGSSTAITNSPSAATQESSYGFTFVTTWNDEPAELGCTPSMTLAFGSIPPGLSFNLLGGYFTGTPTKAGQFPMTFYGDPVTTLCGPDASDLTTVTLTVNPAGSPASPPGSSNWTRSGAAVLAPSSTATDWDGFMIGSPSVVKIGATFHLFYEGLSGTTWRYAIGHATSTDGIAWTRAGASPVLSAGAAGTWDAGGVRYPVVHHDGTTWRLWYQGIGSGSLAIGLATSTDGVTWTRSGTAPVITDGSIVSGYAPGSVVKTATDWVLFYAADGGVGRATSANGSTWTDGGEVIAASGFIRNGRPSVILDGTTWRIWYTRVEGVGSGIVNGAAVFPITVGYGDSPDGTTWTFHGNPVFAPGSAGAWDRPGVGVPSVMKDGTTFRMWYVGGRGNLPGQTWDGNAFVEGSIGYATIP
jgi:predicted GH43/DUF377 family glycosyl hydrolase